MKKIILFITIFTFISCGTYTKTIVKKAGISKKSTKKNLVGIVDKNSFMQVPYQNWFNKNFTNYKIDEISVAGIKKNLNGVTIKGFMGTWCGDSRRETPRFYKIMETAGFNFKKLELITVNHSKRTPNNLQKGFNIIRVPTFIFYRKGIEIGRYVEHPRESLEKDIYKIISGQPYKHSYDK